MCDRINLAECLPADVITFSYYDEKRGGMHHAHVHILRREPIVVTTKGENGNIRSFRFEKTRLGSITLPTHIALGGTTLLLGDGLFREEWTLRHSLQLHHHPELAGLLRQIGQLQTGVELAH